MKRHWWMLTEEEADRLNPPVLRIADDTEDESITWMEYLTDPAWIPMGHIPRPRNRWEWFLHHLYHGYAMRYPWWKVIGFAFANTEPQIDWVAVEELAAEWGELFEDADPIAPESKP